MSSVDIAIRSLKGLRYEEYKLLKTFYLLLHDHEVIDEKILMSKSKMHEDRVRFALDELNSKRLISKSINGYTLLSSGLDALALKELADDDVLIAIGKPLGVGKEADVYEGLSKEGEVAIKFFRIGRISFRDLRKRAYKEHTWLLTCIDAARNEFKALNILYNSRVKVPKPIANVKHVIVMQLIRGYRLNEYRLSNPEDVLNRLLVEIKKAYNAGVVSADLSEYNVLYDGNDIWLIDFPQAISIRHRNAMEFLRRDVRNIISYFKRKYGIRYSLEEAIDFILS